ncbi:hypothetical protein PGTUg99_016611 [Puccinia graminis f. sp. tritici]|uniref:Uncharacterized protein n=1 Tax=Puccinia graminis f. sp. tritici TaxID=56615 RepID=A0A5B0NJ92_PUCGR|nr:hypothetical protein PGTUg99_016611 [Puccinia graminis f. sp. tritici]
MRKQKNHSMFINFSIYLGIDQRGGRPEESDGKAAGNNDEREGSSRTIFESEGYYKDRVGTDVKKFRSRSFGERILECEM